MVWFLLEIDRYIRPIFGFHRYIGIGQNRPQQVLTKRCYILNASRQLVQESTINQIKTVILQQRLQVRFCKQADKMNHQACISCCSQSKNIIINQINKKSI